MDSGATVNPALIRSDAGSPAVLTFMRVAPGMSRALNAAQQQMLSALSGNSNRLAVTGVTNCRIALDLAERGLVTVTDGSLTRRGGSGVIAATLRRPQAT
jgi:hypothetical protein